MSLTVLPEMSPEMSMRESLCYRLHYKTPRFSVTLYRSHDILKRARSPRRVVTDP